jgi:YD repeat-containing protein
VRAVAGGLGGEEDTKRQALCLRGAWHYLAGSSLLSGKSDAAGRMTSYFYNASGQLAERRWARNAGNLKTFYHYNGAGELKLTDYSDATPDVSFLYDGNGHAFQITDAAGARNLSYVHGRLVGESVQSGLLAGFLMGPQYDEQGRLTGTFAIANGTIVSDMMFHLTPGTGRIESFVDALAPGGPLSVGYGYQNNSDLLGATITMQGGEERLRVLRSHDDAGRLTILDAVRGPASVHSHQWTYDAQGRAQHRGS